METISQRHGGGRHRQGAGDREGIPAPRTDGPDDRTSWVTGDLDEEWDDGWDAGATHEEDMRWIDGPDEVWDEHQAGDRDQHRDEHPDEAWDDAPRTEPTPAAGVQRTPAVATGTHHAAPATSTGPQRVVVGRPRRRRAARQSSRWRRIGWLVAAVAAVVGVGLAAVAMFPGLVKDRVEPPPAVPVAAPAASEAAFGQRLQRADGWTIEIGEPRAPKSGDDVDVPADADRVVVLDVVLTNTGVEPRGTSGWTLKAIVGSTPVDVLPEAGAPSRTIRPGASMSFPIAVPMPEGTTDLQLEAAPEDGAPSLFVGTA